MKSTTKESGTKEQLRGKNRSNANTYYQGLCKLNYLLLNKKFAPFMEKWGINGAEFRVILGSLFFCSHYQGALRAIGFVSPVFTQELLHKTVMWGIMTRKKVQRHSLALIDKGFLQGVAGPTGSGGARWLETTGKAQACWDDWDRIYRDHMHAMKIRTRNELQKVYERALKERKRRGPAAGLPGL